MNYYAHGRAFVDDPWFLAGTALPDWLSVSDRGVRVRPKHVEPLLNDDDPQLAALARGVAQHHADDGWFHSTACFAELCWGFTAKLRDLCPADEGLRPSFLGHILVEILLDSALIADEPMRLARYYESIQSLDAGWLEGAILWMTGTPVSRLARFVEIFIAERFLWDYGDDGKLCYRLNQVMRRVPLPPVHEGIMDFLPEARQLVAERKAELLSTTLASISIEPSHEE